MRYHCAISTFFSFIVAALSPQVDSGGTKVVVAVVVPSFVAHTHLGIGEEFQRPMGASEANGRTTQNYELET